MSSLTTMLNRMEAAGLIHRQHGDKDRREVLIFLTETSRALELDYKCLMIEINSMQMSYTPFMCKPCRGGGPRLP